MSVMSLSGVSAVEVSQADARVAAQVWIARGAKRLTASFNGQSGLRGAKTFFGDAGEPVCHAFETEEGGFVVMSADTMLPPVIAFSSRGGVNLDDRDNPFVGFLVEDMRRRMSACTEDGVGRAAGRGLPRSSGSGSAGCRGFTAEWEVLRSQAGYAGQTSAKMSKQEIIHCQCHYQKK